MHCKRCYKIYICLVVLGQLESFRNYKGLRIIFPKILDAILSFTKVTIFLIPTSITRSNPKILATEKRKGLSGLFYPSKLVKFSVLLMKLVFFLLIRVHFYFIFYLIRVDPTQTGGPTFVPASLKACSDPKFFYFSFFFFFYFSCWQTSPCDEINCHNSEVH